MPHWLGAPLVEPTLVSFGFLSTLLGQWRRASGAQMAGDPEGTGRAVRFGQDTI